MKSIFHPFFTLVLIAGLFPAGILQGNSPVPANPSVKYIQRTMKALEESTAENPAQVRVLFYGQSIVAQEWTNTVQETLQKRYPTVQFTFANKAIGGCMSPGLVRTAESDLYPWYPDLLFFHVYGDLDKYREIIQNVRERTTAEIILWSSHLNGGQMPEGFLKDRGERTTTIEKIAQEFKCTYIDLNLKWCHLLIKNKWHPTHLLRDGIHLNQEGCKYYAQFILEELVRLPGVNTDELSSGRITRISVNDPAVRKNPDGSLTLNFHGNRVCAVVKGEVQGEVQENASDAVEEEKTEGNVSLLLDGKPVAEYRELWAHTRTSSATGWKPGIFTIGFRAPLRKEVWTLTALPDSNEDGSRIHYRVEGSVTGFDGEGWSDVYFISRSRRVIIERGDYDLEQHRYSKIKVTKNYRLQWESYPLFAESLIPTTTEPLVLLQNCANADHTLTIQPKESDAKIEAFLIYSPAWKFSAGWK
ncbi:MAG: hypothetical protein Q4D62_07865 [Planctomycetia bacterium]|nr:hypothetical protein [Planctomycetia bacterium]